MNYDHVNQVSDYFRDEVFPYLSSLVSIQDFRDYLTRMALTKSGSWLKKEHRVFPVNYFVEPTKFVQRYSQKCVCFMGSTDPREGAMHIVYQISPTLHILARLYNWIEDQRTHAYLMLTAVYQTDEEFIKFFDSNKDIRLTGDTTEKVEGFAAATKIPGFGGFKTQIQDDPEDK